MADYNGLKPGEVLADASVAEFISRLGLGIAEAQRALDENSIDQLGEFLKKRDDLGNQSLLDLGLLPAFYHYQYADISCSLQLSLKVQESFGVDLKLSTDIKNESTDASSNETSETTTESGSSSSTSTRSALIAIRIGAPGTLKVGGTDFALAATNPEARIADLATRLRGDPATGVARALAVPKLTPVNPEAVPPSARIITSPNAVAFLSGGFDHGIIEIKAVPDAPETFTLNGATKVTTSPPAASRLAYADALAVLIKAKGFGASAYDSTRDGGNIHFDFDSALIRPGYDAGSLSRTAVYLKATGHRMRIVAHTDRSGPDDYNVKLGNQRVAAMFDFLVANGVPPAQLDKVPSTGEKRWKGDPGPEKNEAHRLGETLITDTTSAFVAINGDETHELTGIDPDHRGQPQATGNGFVALYDAVNSAITGTKIVIKGEEFALSGAAGGGSAKFSGEAYAFNLAAAVNSNPKVKVKAWPTGNVTNLANDTDEVGVELLSVSGAEIVLAGTDAVTVTSQFTRTKAAKTSVAKTGNTSVAFGASLDLRYARSFEMNVTGNSAISARLVSIPAPPEFLAAIKEFLKP